MNSQMNNETKCCVCLEYSISHKCRTCVGGVCHICYCELEYSVMYSLVDCPMCRTPMITDFISVRLIDIIQDWNLRGKEDDLPVIKLLFKNVNPHSNDLCHTCNNWKAKCVCIKCEKWVKKVIKKIPKCSKCGEHQTKTDYSTPFPYTRKDVCVNCDV